MNVFPNVKQIRLKHSRNVIISNLNINPFPNEFDPLKLLLNSTPDTLVLTVTKLDDYFPSSQFYIDGYSMSYKLDIYCNGLGAWLLAGTYYSPAKNVRYFFYYFDKALDYYSSYVKIIFGADFNTEVSENCLDTFRYQHKVKSFFQE